MSTPEWVPGGLKRIGDVVLKTTILCAVICVLYHFKYAFIRRYKSKPKIESPKPPIDKACMQAYDMSNKG